MMDQVPDKAVAIDLRPAHLHLVAPELAHRVAAPAYDVLPADARRTEARDPLSFLNVLSAPDADGHLRHDRSALDRMLRDGVFDRGRRAFAWYRISSDAHSQTGLVAEISLADYDAGLIVRHEHTRAEREAELAAYIRDVAADTSPVSLAFQGHQALRALAASATSGPPDVCFASDDGVEHAVWRTTDPHVTATIAAVASSVATLYVTDGHHRLAAASQVAAAARRDGAALDAAELWLLAVLFPARDMRILPFHRVVSRPRHMRHGDLLEAFEARATVTPLDWPAPPPSTSSVTLWLDGRWYQLDVEPDAVGEGPLARLAVTVLHDAILGPVLGVHEPRVDPRLGYVAGGPQAVAEHCERHGTIGFVIRATTMDELIAVSDRGAVMPPKSTLFSPKPRAGIVVRLLR